MNHAVPTRELAHPVSATLGTLALGVSAIACFGLLWHDLPAAWDGDSNYSHGYLVPLVSIWLAWRAWIRPAAGEPRLAAISLLLGAMVATFHAVVPWPMVAFTATALLLRGIAVAVGGSVWARRFTFPILFLGFAFPLPVAWTDAAGLWLQDVVASSAGSVLDRFVPTTRMGTTLRIDGLTMPLVVAEECSGLRQVMAFLAFAALLGHLGKPSLLRSTALLLLAVPFAVLGNVARVLLMAGVAYRFGPEYTQGWLHYAPAAVSIPIGFGLLLLTDKLLGRFGHDGVPDNSQPIGTLGLVPAAAFLCVSAIAQLAMSQHVAPTAIEYFPLMQGELERLPNSLGTPEDHWTLIERTPIARLNEIVTYQHEDALLRTYQLDGTRTTAQVFAVYSRAGEDRKHHPEICVRDAAGAMEIRDDRQVIALDETPGREVQRFAFRTQSVGQTTFYYWHYGLDAPQRTGQTAMQELHRRLGRTMPSVTIQVATDTMDFPDRARLERTLLKAVDDAFRRDCLPPTAVMDRTRLPVALLRE